MTWNLVSYKGEIAAVDLAIKEQKQNKNLALRFLFWVYSPWIRCEFTLNWEQHANSQSGQGGGGIGRWTLRSTHNPGLQVRRRRQCQVRLCTAPHSALDALPHELVFGLVKGEKREPPLDRISTEINDWSGHHFLCVHIFRFICLTLSRLCTLPPARGFAYLSSVIGKLRHLLRTIAWCHMAGPASRHPKEWSWRPVWVFWLWNEKKDNSFSKGKRIHDQKQHWSKEQQKGHRCTVELRLLRISLLL